MNTGSTFPLLDGHRISLLTLAERGRMDDEVASALDSATRGAIIERGLPDSGEAGLPWPSDAEVTFARVKAHSRVIEALARRFELRFDRPGLAEKIARDLANAAVGLPVALEVQVHGAPVIVPDLGPVWSAMLLAHEHAIGELETVSDF